jgi:alkylhydroperoxidase family enzyme
VGSVDVSGRRWQNGRVTPAERMSMEWGECWLEPAPMPRELVADLKRRTGGVVPAWAPRLASVPWVVRANASGILERVAFMPVGLWDLIGFVVSQDNSCRYCYGMTRTILKVLGYRDAQVDRIERDVHLAELPPPEEAALDFARKLSHANPRPTPADGDALERAGHDRSAVAEIACAAAFAGFPNRIATCFAIPPEPFERFAESTMGRLLRPILARRMRGKRVPPAPLPSPNPDPCARLVAALAGSPFARMVRDMVDQAMASPVLPRRTKLLMIAVVARALGCAYCEGEARTGLDLEGFDAAAVDEILANLGSAKLDRRDALLVPFARETVRYQTVAIQRRTRELAGELAIEEVIEAVGIAALANSIARLSVLLETC